MRPEMTWIKTSDRLPTASDHPCGPTRKNIWGQQVPVSRVPCLVVTVENPSEVKMAQWNTHERCWDDAESDDFWRNPDEISHWMVVPAPPAPPEEVPHA